MKDSLPAILNVFKLNNPKDVERVIPILSANSSLNEKAYDALLKLFTGGIDKDPIYAILHAEFESEKTLKALNEYVSINVPINKREEFSFPPKSAKF